MSDESGLKDLLKDAAGGTREDHPHRHYPYHEFEDKAWEWFNEYEKRFPTDVECDFIEVSTKMTSHHAKAYYRDGGKHQFIRFSKSYVERANDWKLSRTLLHEMVHLYCYTHGHKDVSDGSHIFKWLCGAVGAPINPVRYESPEWIDLAEGFITE